MNLFKLIFFCLLIAPSLVHAEIIETDNDALAVYGSACENMQANVQNTTIRMKATDKACFSAISSLPEIVDIKDSFEEHDFNMMVYHLIDEYLEDLTTKTVKQDNSQICIEISGYITPENIGKAIDETIQTPSLDEKNVIETVSSEESSSLTPQVTEVSNDTSRFVVLSSIFVRPTEFYNNTKSSSHSVVLKNILQAKSDHIRIVESEDEASFVVTPRVLKAKIEPLNNQTSRMQMVIALDIFDKNDQTSVSEHQNKFILFNNTDDEQVIAKTLLKDLLEKGSSSILNFAEKRENKLLKQQSPLILSSDTNGSSTTIPAGADVVSAE